VEGVQLEKSEQACALWLSMILVSDFVVQIDSLKFKLYLFRNTVFGQFFLAKIRRYSMNSQDIRWVQRYKHFAQACGQLNRAVELARQRPLSELEEQGLIQSFEYTHELAWNTLKDFLENKGVQPLYGSKDTTREAFKRELIEEGDVWMQMIKSRNLTSHTYNREIAEEIALAIRQHYHAAFRKLLETLEPFSRETPE